MSLDRCVSVTQRTPDLRGVPNLAMIMRHHVPEPPQGRRRHLHSEAPEIALQKRLDEILAPLAAFRVRLSQKRARKATAPPQLPQFLCADLVQIKTGHWHKCHTSGEGLRDAPHD